MARRGPGCARGVDRPGADGRRRRGDGRGAGGGDGRLVPRGHGDTARWASRSWRRSACSATAGRPRSRWRRPRGWCWSRRSARSDGRDDAGHRRAAAGGDRRRGEAGDRRHRRQRDQRRRRRAGPGPGLPAARRAAASSTPAAAAWTGWPGSTPPAGVRSWTAIEVAVACDVTNPLCGPRGASAVYGPQKGATPAMVEELDANLAHFAAIVERDLGVSIRESRAPAPPAAWAAAWSPSPAAGSSRGSTW